MSLRPRSALGAATALGLTALAVAAQQAPGPTEKRPAPPAEAAPGPESLPAPAPQKRRAAPPSETPAGQMLGLNVFSSDGGRVGDVRAVNLSPDGRIAALHVRTGGFLGFGARTVAIPEGKFARSAEGVRLTLTADEVSSLPEIKAGR